jgi:hypothetical protein
LDMRRIREELRRDEGGDAEDDEGDEGDDGG